MHLSSALKGVSGIEAIISLYRQEAAAEHHTAESSTVEVCCTAEQDEYFKTQYPLHEMLLRLLQGSFD